MDLRKLWAKEIVRGGMIALIGILFCACSAEKKAREIFEIAEFEEVQFNETHARELYQKILDKYPDTETASRARQALLRLGSGQQESEEN